MTSPRREEVIRALPYARRYARALSGSQAGGDALVADSLRDVLGGAAPEPEPSLPARLFLYRAITRRFNTSAAGAEPGVAPGTLSCEQRQSLLLFSLEELSPAEAAVVLDLSEAEIGPLLERARARLREGAAADVLIIEDEPIIAMDLEELVQGCGHRVVGVASSEAEAVECARRTRPGLILADINLGAGGDGASAVSTITRNLDVPVIFVTAYPERLLTGEAVEPAFVITKPFEPLTLAIATYQAVTGGVRLA